MRLLQFIDRGGARVGRVEANGTVSPLARFESTYQVARKAIAERKTLEQLVSEEPCDAVIAYAELASIWARPRRVTPCIRSWPETPSSPTP
jgi:hypothetical protein